MARRSELTIWAAPSAAFAKAETIGEVWVNGLSFADAEEGSGTPGR